MGVGGADRTIVVRLRAEVADFKKQFAEATKSSQQLSGQVDADGRKIETSLGRMTRAAQLNRDTWSQAGTTLTLFGTAALAGLGLAVNAAMDWESAWAGVLKVVDGTPEELAAVQQGLRDLSKELPDSAVQIAAVAAAAGQLGVEAPDIVEFTRTMVNLGNTTNLSATDAAVALARFANIMGTSISETDRMGSTVVALGNNSATTEREIVEFATRLAASGRIAHLSEAQIFAYAATLTSVGVEAEAGGTAIGKTFTAINDAVLDGGRQLEVFAEVAGMSAADFQKAYGEDSGATIAKFITGLGQMSKSGQSTTAVFDELGLTDERLKRALLSAGQAQGLLTSELGLATEAWDENNALTAEANKRYSTTASQVKIARNAINDASITIGQSFLPLIGDAAGLLTHMADAFSQLPEPLQQTVGWIVLLGGGVMLLAGGFLMLAPRVIQTQAALVTLQASAAGASTGVTVLATTTKIAAISMGAVLGVITLLTIGLSLAAVGSKQAKDRAKEYADTLDEVSGALTEATRDLAKQRLQADDAYDSAQRFGISLETVTDAALGNADALEILRAKEREVVDERMRAQATGDIRLWDEDVEAIRNLVNAVERQSGALTDAKEDQLQNREAMVGAENAARDLAGTTDDLASSTAAYNKELKETLKLQRDAAGIILSERDATRQYEGAIDDIAEAMGAEGWTKTLDVSTEAGRANQEMLDGLVDSGWDVVESMAEAGRSNDDMAASMQRSREDVINAAIALGMTDAEANTLADDLRLVPSLIPIEVQSNIAAATSASDLLAAALERIPRKIGIEILAAGAKTNIGTLYLSPIARADGGAVFGPGGPRSDSILARLSNNEHVWSAMEVDGTPGGHRGIEYLRSLARSKRLSLPALADGGRVGGGTYMSPSSSLSVRSAVSMAGARVVVKIGEKEFEGYVAGIAGAVDEGTIRPLDHGGPTW